tara:strand:+ start:605 stop:1237 length:633 start_codon:yes stop_codon:yes gene_type:complete
MEIDVEIQCGTKSLLKFIFRALFLTLFLNPLSSYSAEFKVIGSSSSVKWKATKVMGGHNGTIKISRGSLKIDKGNILGGLFKIDMNSIVCLDLDSEGPWNQKLVNHLKSDDFFSVSKHPHSSLKVTGSKKEKDGSHLISGELTIKGIKKPLNFKAFVKIDGNKLSASGDIVFDRTDYDIRFRSGKFFEDLGNRLIHDKVFLKVNLVGKKE